MKKNKCDNLMSTSFLKSLKITEINTTDKSNNKIEQINIDYLVLKNSIDNFIKKNLKIK